MYFLKNTNLRVFIKFCNLLLVLFSDGHNQKHVLNRIAILGFQDPQVFQLERSAPTPTHEGSTATLQFLASTESKCCSADIKNAFGQARKTSGQIPIYGMLPPGGVREMD